MAFAEDERGDGSFVIVAANGGGMAEWLIATALKAVRPKGLVGSNPTPS
jgi:hypothetical protein